MIPYFCVFEGGGAKGIAHLSTLRAIKAQQPGNGLYPLGYAGTSAGAIIAALAAAGWTADELLDSGSKPARSPALEAVERTGVTSLLELLKLEARWKLGLIARLPVLLCIVGVLAVVTALLCHPWGLLIVLASGALLAWCLATRFKGLVDILEIEPLIEDLLRHGLERAETRKGGTLPPNGQVTFGLLRDVMGVDLTIIAARLDDRQMVRFDPDRTPGESVARAVCASAALPLVFKPVMIGGRPHCDGGIVSNLPAWTFDKPGALAMNPMVITSEIAASSEDDKAVRRWRKGLSAVTGWLFGDRGWGTRDRRIARPIAGLHLVRQVVTTGFFGARLLEMRGLRNHLSLPLDTATIGTLDFADTAAHLPVLRALDVAIGTTIQKHIQVMREAASREVLYRAALDDILEVDPDMLGVIHLKADRAENGAICGFRPWHVGGSRDYRWHAYEASIREAMATSVVVGSRAPTETDADWCVALPLDTKHTDVVLCLGVGGAERIGDIGRLLREAEIIVSARRATA